MKARPEAASDAASSPAADAASDRGRFALTMLAALLLSGCFIDLISWLPH